MAVSAPSAFVHAIGGSLGSALALLLFYPLERSRLELQTHVSRTPTNVNDGVFDSPVAPRVSSSSPSLESSSSSSLDLSPPNTDDVDVVVDEIVRHHHHHHHYDGTAGSDTSWSMNSYAATSSDDDNDDVVNVNNLTTLTVDSTTPRKSTSKKKTAMATTTTTTNSQSVVTTTTTTKTRQQQNNGIISTIIDLASRGQLYKGVAPIITTTFISQFIFFFMNTYVKRLIMRATFLSSSSSSSSSSRAVRNLVASCIAGIGNVLLTNPLWVTNMTIVTGKTQTQNLFHELVHLFRTRGIRHLWDGTGASIMLVSNPIIQFFCYEELKQLRLNMSSNNNNNNSKMNVVGGPNKSELNAVETFLLAALAKAVATVLTYPLQLTQTLLRLGDDDDGDDNNKNTNSKRVDTGEGCNGNGQHSRYEGTRDCLYQLYKTKGMASWYTGMRAKMIQTVLTAAFTFLTYEQLVTAVHAVLKSEAILATRGRQNLQR